MNRRQLFRFGAAAVLTAAIAPVASALSAPTLWGDGEHDDTEALEAALNGRPVRIAGQSVTIQSGELVGGKFLLSRTVDAGALLNITGAKFVATSDFVGDYLMVMKYTPSGKINIADSHFDARAVPGGLRAVVSVEGNVSMHSGTYFARR